MHLIGSSDEIARLEQSRLNFNKIITLEERKMNNLETECLELLTDILSNPPKKSNGELAKFTDEEREKYFSLISKKQRDLNAISITRYALLNDIYEAIKRYVEHNSNNSHN